ncbi:hypothetical protein [uncultured Tateyamaria sp.]|uniref:hypothetical protein n=1 Tax=uncultured Tateyamaria sp. TaxID=455651 RepID=UPI002625A9CC|nr:hypothetical protein [uncultured Tateyamaria sp.]
MIRWTVPIVLSAIALGTQVHAQDALQTCSKMQAEGRLGPLTLLQCQCNYAVAEQELDPDIRALLFDAWHTGNNNMAKVEALKPRSRVEKQFKAMERALRKTCQ